MAQEKKHIIPIELDERLVSREALLQSVFMENVYFLAYYLRIKSKVMKLLTLDVIEFLSRTNTQGKLVEPNYESLKKELVDKWNKVRMEEENRKKIKNVRHEAQLLRVLEKLTSMKLIKKRKTVIMGKRSKPGKRKKNSLYSIDLNNIAISLLNERSIFEKYPDDNNFSYVRTLRLLEELAPLVEVKNYLSSRYGTEDLFSVIEGRNINVNPITREREIEKCNELRWLFENSGSPQFRGMTIPGEKILTIKWRLERRKIEDLKEVTDTDDIEYCAHCYAAKNPGWLP